MPVGGVQHPACCGHRPCPKSIDRVLGSNPSLASINWPDGEIGITILMIGF